ncbi:hypothetical protein BSR28_00245 [Boudabousia liubingyangii]|uniref:exonuclease domain-containing protein n=1 Tax=Boudabousia liubingyangii TaxID=1921764 RepID=UPI00093F73F7|nr:exonuclease domain-containing protein [Boudabousia liubingyangii]OKL48182.1 hypothetical protein BSR28_00245 [Boudabousia liubingyangii]
MNGFVAIDFETANERRASACSIGLARFAPTGELLETFSTLIMPHTLMNYFSPRNVLVHGITPADVAGAPSWEEVFPKFQAFVGSTPLVAHNMAFDGYVLSDLGKLYELPEVNNRRFCTVRLARKLLAGELRSATLDSVFNWYFPGESFQHHDASADAVAAGRIFARMLQEHPLSEIEQHCPSTNATRRVRGII